MEGIKIFPFRQGKGDLESAHHRVQDLMDCIVVPQGKAEGTHLFSGKPAPQSSFAVPFLPRLFGRGKSRMDISAVPFVTLTLKIRLPLQLTLQGS